MGDPPNIRMEAPQASGNDLRIHTIGQKLMVRNLKQQKYVISGH